MIYRFAQPITQAYRDPQYVSFPAIPFLSTKTVVNSCGAGQGEPDISVTRSAYSFVSQEDADDQAQTAAEEIATAMRALHPCPNALF